MELKIKDPGSALTHFIAMLTAMVAATPLLIKAASVPGTMHLKALSVFIVSMILLYAASTVYHTFDISEHVNKILRKIDHMMIFILIAGTYTPIALSVIGGWQGTFITVLQWAMVLFGIIYKSLARRSIPAISLTIYLVMGWTIVFFMPLFVRHASMPLLVLIAAGGVLYTAGAWVYARKGFRYHHMVWLLLINLAAICHFTAIVFYLY